VTLLEILKSAYAIGGASAVLFSVLIAAVVTLWRRLQKEHEARLRESRKDLQLLTEMMDTVQEKNIRRSRHGEELMDYDDDEDTGCTYRRRDRVHRKARALIDSYRPR
jgi:hypothetical protein